MKANVYIHSVGAIILFGNSFECNILAKVNMAHKNYYL